MSYFLEKKLMKRRQKGNLRESNLTQLELKSNLIDFASNDYLGLARSQGLAHHVRRELAEHSSHLTGFGSTGSRLLTGDTRYARELEESLALFHGYEAGVLFTCGYLANSGLFSAITTNGDVIFFDDKIHASMREGLRLSRARCFPFRHCNLEHLEKRLQQCPAEGQRFICVEAIYSTDGSITSLVQVCHLAKKYGAHVIIDEAHSLGLLGPQGKGLVAQYGLQSSIFAQINTFGKALGVQGAMILGSQLLKKVLINFCSSYIYTTAPPFYALAAIKSSYTLFPQLNQERQHLQHLIALFNQAFVHSSHTPIQSIKIQGNHQVKQFAKKLCDKGLDVRPLMSPTVQRGQELVRICLHAFNTKKEVEALIEQIILNRDVCHV